MPATIDPIELIDRLDADAIRAELDAIYAREAALRAALKLARARDRRRAQRPRRPMRPRNGGGPNGR